MATILHTSDTHLDVLTYNQPRVVDHESILEETLQIARQTKPDLVLHTGDLFHMVRPSTEAMHRAITWLQELAALSRNGVVIECGNHDSPNLFRLFARILGPASQIRFIDKARMPRAGGVLDFPGPRGQRIRVASLPFVHANRVLDEEIFGDVSKWTGTYADYIHKVEQILGQGLSDGYDPAKDVLFFAAHMHVAGATFSGSERPLHISEIYGSSLETLPVVNYAAFGHIHKPQALPGTLIAGAYAGSPIPIDFGEEGEQKSIVIVEAEPQTPTRVERHALSGGRPLRNLKGSMEDLRALAPGVGAALCLVTVHSKEPMVELADQVRDLFPDATLLQVNEECENRKLQPLSRKDVADAEDQDFTELFHDFLAQRGTRVGSAERVLQTFKSLIESVGDEVAPVFPEERLLAGAGTDSPLGKDAA